jgi:hypothetical protein
VARHRTEAAAHRVRAYIGRRSEPCQHPVGENLPGLRLTPDMASEQPKSSLWSGGAPPGRTPPSGRNGCGKLRSGGRLD